MRATRKLPSEKAGRKVSSKSPATRFCSAPLTRADLSAAGTPRDILASDIGAEVHVGSSMSGDGERRIDYHVFELEVDPNALCSDW